MKSHDYEHPGQIVSGIEWSMPPQPPRRRCESCPTLLRQSNPGTMCAVCERKAVKSPTPGPASALRLSPQMDESAALEHVMRFSKTDLNRLIKRSKVPRSEARELCERKVVREQVEKAKRVRPRTESLNERLLRYDRESA